jgi:hypothetical protein
VGCPPLAFTPIQDDPDIPPVLKLVPQLFVPIQTSACHDKEEQCQAPLGGIMTGLTDLPVIFGGCVYLISLSFSLILTLG